MGAQDGRMGVGGEADGGSRRRRGEEGGPQDGAVGPGQAEAEAQPIPVPDPIDLLVLTRP